MQTIVVFLQSSWSWAMTVCATVALAFTTHTLPWNVHRFQEARHEEITRMKNEGCAFCCSKGVINSELCGGMAAWDLIDEQMRKGMGQLGSPSDQKQTNAVWAKNNLTSKQYFKISAQMTARCLSGDENACRIGCGGEIEVCQSRAITLGRSASTATQNSVATSEPVCGKSESDDLATKTATEWSTVSALLIDADDVRRTIAGMNGLGKNDTLKQPNLASFSYEKMSGITANSVLLGATGPIIAGAKMLGDAMSNTIEQAKTIEDARALLLWQIAIGRVAEGLTESLQDSAFKPIGDNSKVFSDISDAAEKTVSVVKQTGAYKNVKPLNDLSTVIRNGLVTIRGFKSRYATKAAGLERVSGFLTATVALASAVGGGATYLSERELIDLMKSALVIDWLVEVVTPYATSQSALGKVLANYGAIASVMTNEAQTDLMITLLKASLTMAAALKTAGVIAGLGTGIVPGIAALAAGLVLDTAVNAVFEPYEYMRAYNVAALDYTLASIVSPSGTNEQLVRATAISVGNQLMNQSVVGKIVPRLLNPAEWPFLSGAAVSFRYGIMSEPNADKNWREYLDRYYGKVRANLLVTDLVVWTSNSQGSLDLPIKKAIGCILSL